MALLNFTFDRSKFSPSNLAQRWRAVTGTLRKTASQLSKEYTQFARKPYEAVYRGKPQLEPIKQRLQPIRQYAQQVQQRAKTPFPELVQQTQERARQQPGYQSSFRQQARKAIVPPPPLFAETGVYQQQIKPRLEPLGLQVTPFLRLPVGQFATTMIEEYPEMKGIREKLGKGEPLTSTEKEIAQKEQMFAVADIALTGPKKGIKKAPKYDFNINLKRLKLSPEETATFRKVIDQIRPQLEAAKGKKLSQQEIVNTAAKSDALQKITTRAETLKSTAAMNKSRQLMAGLDQEITALQKTGKLKEAEVKIKDLTDSLRVVSSTAADWGRKLKSLDTVVGGESLRQRMLEEIGKIEADSAKIAKEAVKVDWSNGRSITKFYRDFVKPSGGEILREFRYNNMLSNPRTHLRNFFANVWQTFMIRPTTKLIAEGPVPAVKYYKGILSSLPDAFEAFKSSLSGEAMIRKPDIRFIPSGKLPSFYGIPSRAMEAGDVLFRTLIKSGEEVAGKAPEEAAEIAEYSLFRADLDPTGKSQGYLLSKIDQFTAGVYQLRKVGLDWFIPFVQTPMNVAKQWLEYSPTGLATIPGAARKKEQMAKWMMGSIVSLVGAKVAMDSNTTWQAPRGEEEKKAFYESGRKRFSMKIGDRWVPMIYFGPFALALAIPAAVKHYNDESKTALTDSQLEKLGHVAGDMADFFSQQTFLQGLGTFVNLVTGRADYRMPGALAFTLGQTIPMEGLVRYVTTVLDPIYRKSKGFKEGLMKDLPLVSKQLEPYTTPTGEPAKRGWTSYLMPYDIGAAKPEWDVHYKQTMKESQLKSGVNKVLQGDPGDVANFERSLEQVNFETSGTLLNQMYQEKEWRSKMKAIFKSTKIDNEAKERLITKMGGDPNQVAYDSVQDLNVNERSTYIEKLFEGVDEKNKFELLTYFRIHRSTDDNYPILSDAVIKELKKRGVITDRDATHLKNLGKETKPKKPALYKLKKGPAPAKVPSIKLPKISYQLPKAGLLKAQKLAISAPPEDIKIALNEAQIARNRKLKALSTISKQLGR